MQLPCSVDQKTGRCLSVSVPACPVTAAISNNVGTAGLEHSPAGKEQGPHTASLQKEDTCVGFGLP